MANPFPVEIVDENGLVRLAGQADFTDSGNQPGGTFNGGTITSALEIDGSQDVEQLAVKAFTGQNSNLVSYKASGGGTVAFIGPDGAAGFNGQVTVGGATAGNVTTLFVDGSGTTNHDVVQALGSGGRRGGVNTEGALFTNLNTAPADADLFEAGRILAWFDSADGASALRLKAKQADGTIQTGFVTLAMPGSGALSTVQLVTATGAQILTTRDAETITPCTFNPGVATTATVTVALSPDNVTYSTLGVETEPAGTAFDGTIHLVKVRVPAGWYIKLTVNAQAVLGLTTYY